MPDWVEATCRLPLVYRTGDKSIRQLFEAARDQLHDRAAFIAAAAQWLRHHPELINAWQGYSEDKRRPGPYLELTSLKVGCYDVASGHRDVHVHGDPVDACADFIYREALAVLGTARRR